MRVLGGMLANMFLIIRFLDIPFYSLHLYILIYTHTFYTDIDLCSFSFNYPYMSLCYVSLFPNLKIFSYLHIDTTFD